MKSIGYQERSLVSKSMGTTLECANKVHRRDWQRCVSIFTTYLYDPLNSISQNLLKEWPWTFGSFTSPSTQSGIQFGTQPGATAYNTNGSVWYPDLRSRDPSEARD
jgi:hypothetical protein